MTTQPGMMMMDGGYEMNQVRCRYRKIPHTCDTTMIQHTVDDTTKLIIVPGTRFMINDAAASAFDLPTSLNRNKNCRLRLLISIVSKSIT